MTKLTKNEKLLREATSKWNKFLKEGAFKKTVNEDDDSEDWRSDMPTRDETPLPPEKKVATGWFDIGDKVRIMGRVSKKREPIPEKYRCRYAIVKGFNKENDQEVIVQFDDGDVANINHADASKNPKMWEMDFLYPCEDNLSEGGTMGEYGKMDAEQGLPPTKIGRGNEEYMAAYNAVLQARGEDPLDIQQPDQAYLDALRSGQLEENEKNFKVGDFVRIVSGGLKGATGKVIELTTLITNEPGLVVLLDSPADKRVFGQAGDEVVVGLEHVEPPIGQMRENEKNFKVGDEVRIIAGGAAGGEGKVVNTSKGEFGTLAFIVKLEKDADDSSNGRAGEEVAVQPEHLDDRFYRGDFGMELYDIDEKLSAADKEFHKSVMNKGKVPNLKGDMGPLPGLEGPFQFRSGAVLYYDPKAGKYYDRGKDMYLDNDEASRLIMEKDEKEFAKIFARAKDMLVLSARSRVPVSLKSVQSALDVIKVPSEMEKGKLIVKNEYIIADKNELPESAKQISFTKYAMDYLSNLPGEQLDLPME